MLEQHELDLAAGVSPTASISVPVVSRAAATR
jgi:hypothetical protein